MDSPESKKKLILFVIVVVIMLGLMMFALNGSYQGICTNGIEKETGALHCGGRHHAGLAGHFRGDHAELPSACKMNWSFYLTIFLP